MDFHHLILKFELFIVYFGEVLTHRTVIIHDCFEVYLFFRFQRTFGLNWLGLFIGVIGDDVF